jgi:hypothetical protein
MIDPPISRASDSFTIATPARRHPSSSENARPRTTSVPTVAKYDGLTMRSSA